MTDRWKDMQNQFKSSNTKTLTGLSEEVNALLSKKPPKKKKACLPPQQQSVLEMTKVILSSSESDSDFSSEIMPSASSVKTAKFVPNSLPCTENISVLSQELDQLLLSKQKKRAKLPQPKKKQKSRQRKVLKEISHLISDTSSSEDDVPPMHAVTMKVSNKENMSSVAKDVLLVDKSQFIHSDASLSSRMEDISHDSITSGLSKSSFGDRECAEKLEDQSKLVKDITAFIMLDSSSAGSEDDHVTSLTKEASVSQKELVMEEEAHSTEHCTQHNHKGQQSVLNQVADSVDSDPLAMIETGQDGMSNKVTDRVESDHLVNIDKEHQNASNKVPDIDKSDHLEKMDISSSTGNDEASVSGHSIDIKEDCSLSEAVSSGNLNCKQSTKFSPFRCIPKPDCVISDSDSCGVNTSLHSEPSLSVENANPKLKGNPEQLTLLSQEIGSLLKSMSERKPKKKKKAPTKGNISLMNDRDLANTKLKKGPSAQKKALQQISELFSSDSDVEKDGITEENSSSVKSDNGISFNISSSGSATADIELLEKQPEKIEVNPHKGDSRAIVGGSLQIDALESTNATTKSKIFESHEENNVQSKLKRGENDFSTSILKVSSDSEELIAYGGVIHKNKSAIKTKKFGSTSKASRASSVVFADFTDDSDTAENVSDQEYSGKQCKKTSLAQNKEDSESSSEGECNELYTTALKHISPDNKAGESSSEEDMLEQFLEKMKIDTEKTNTSGSSHQSHSLDSFIVSDDESLSGEDNNEEFYLTSLSHRSQEEFDKNTFSSGQRSDSVRSRKDTNSAFKTPGSQHLSFSSDSDDLFTPAAKSSNLRQIKTKDSYRNDIMSTPGLVVKGRTSDVVSLVSSDSDEDISHCARPVLFKTPLSTPANYRKDKQASVKPCSFLQCLSDNQSKVHQKNCEAEKYKKHFKKYKEELSTRLFALYNKSCFNSELPADTSVQWNSRLLKTAGYCSYKRKVESGTVARFVLIELSTKVCDTAERVRDTLIHEMCHAAVWIIHGSTEGHGPVWKTYARRANRIHPEVPTISRCHDYAINTKFTYKCTGCSYEIGRHSKSLDTDKKVCGYCKSPFQLLRNSDRPGSSSSVPATPKTPRTPNAFALYVKENYGSVKKDYKGISHKDVMSKLSTDFKAEKQKLSLS